MQRRADAFHQRRHSPLRFVGLTGSVLTPAGQASVAMSAIREQIRLGSANSSRTAKLLRAAVRENEMDQRCTGSQ